MSGLVRTTIMLDDDIYTKLRNIQAELTEKESRNVTFSEVIRIMTRNGLMK